MARAPRSNKSDLRFDQQKTEISSVFTVTGLIIDVVCFYWFQRCFLIKKKHEEQQTLMLSDVLFSAAVSRHRACDHSATRPLSRLSRHASRLQL